MPDRSLRLPPLLLRERRPSPTPPQENGNAPGNGSGSAGGGDSSDGRDSSGRDSSDGRDSAGAGSAPGSDADHNPFAPPPEGTPDQPWQPRRPAGGDRGEGSDDQQNSPWGSQWSDRQPGPGGGGFGDRPGAPNGQSGPGEGREGGTGGPGTGMRWDPADPAQRRARYSLLAGMWAFFFALFSWPYVALLLGALAMYWGVSSVRAKPRTPEPGAPAPDPGARPQTSAAVSGLVTASLALAMVALTFTAQLVYSDYYTCTKDALTTAAEQSCENKLPGPLRDVLGTG